MSMQKHIHRGKRYIKTTKGDDIHIELWAMGSVLGQDWLPDKALFETDLVVMFVEADGSVALYHPGVVYYSAMTISHLASVAATMYGMYRGERQLPFNAQSQVEKFQRDYDELSHFQDQGYYIGRRMILRGKITRHQLHGEAHS
jgi:hypothetical protein